ncbi:FadR/GntR family transcriptional regulator [Novosphingobium sp. BL-8H]
MNDRLYQDLAQKLLAEIADGVWPVGTRLPAERDLAQTYSVSRPTVREAIIALEVQGLVEVRIGAGTYVVSLPGKTHLSGFDISAIELTEARLLFEGEAAALAATQISDEEIGEIEALIDAIARENNDPAGTVQADEAFHLTIARATRNKAIFEAVERLWQLRYKSPEAALLHAKARTANVKPVVEEHTAILDALKARDPAEARNAMRRHLGSVLEGLLFATEERAIAAARQDAAEKRARYRRAME